MINFNINSSNSIGFKLMLSFLAILIIAVIAISIAIVSMSQIKIVQGTLTESSIPSLSHANKLSLIAASLVEFSLNMSEDNNIQELKEGEKTISKLNDDFQLELSSLKNKESNYTGLDELATLDRQLQSNVTRKFKALSNIHKVKTIYHQQIKQIHASSRTLLDQLSIIKVEREIALSKIVDSLSLEELKFSQDNIISGKVNDNIYAVEQMANLVNKLNNLIGSIKDLDSAATKNHVLLIKEEFDYTLSVVIRAIVNIGDENIRGELAEHIANLSKLGQENANVFETQLDKISLQDRLKEINHENVSMLHQLSQNLDYLVEAIQNDTNLDSTALSKTINQSIGILIVMLIVAIAVSGLIVWIFVYKHTVLKLHSLSEATRRISNREYDFEIDKSGEKEFYNIAMALAGLQKNAKQRDAINLLLSDKSERLKRSNEDLSQFAYVASHDLQEPLRMIGSYVQLLSKRYQGKIDKDADKFINYAVEGCNRMQMLIEGLLRFSRIDSNKDEMEHIDTHKALEEVTYDLSMRIKESNTQISWDELLPVFACSTQLKTVFQNLISNGIKYCDARDPEIKIESKLVDGGKVQFSVSDNGIGIEEQYQEKIFIIFKRLHSRNEYSGTGIGLSICKKIIERHGGDIWLTSTPGEGTTFYFTLPSSKQNVMYDEQSVAV